MNERMSAADRRDQIIRVADAMISDLGYLPLPIGALSHKAEISRALIYARFASQHELVNTVLQYHFDRLHAKGLFAAVARLQTLAEVHDVASIYLSHVAEAGPALHVGFRELFMKGQIESSLLARRDRIFRTLGRVTRHELRLRTSDAVAAMQMLLTIPEELGRIVFEKDLGLDDALKLSRRLLNSSIDALRPND